MSAQVPFPEWLRDAAAPERYVYHIGQTAGGPWNNAVRVAYNDGLITLVQQRDGSRFRYIAVRLERQRPPPYYGRFQFHAEANL